ncbi:hypothetical protein BDZ91DRAFT_730779 [Kalaharituber pfeilii]|nr:hypothetical protein BDZ91DRAFT_730779 [Kalaharituber pfeilii]
MIRSCLKQHILSRWRKKEYGPASTVGGSGRNDTVGVSKINSLQNGLLLREDILSLFDQYPVSVNQDVRLLVVERISLLGRANP